MDTKKEYTINTFRQTSTAEQRLAIVERKRLELPQKVPICLFRAELRDTMLLPYIHPQLLVDGDMNFSWTMQLVKRKKMMQHEKQMEKQNGEESKFAQEEKKHLTLDPSETLFYFIYKYKGDETKPCVNGIIPSGSLCMSQIYDEYKSDDGLLYIVYAKESTMGN